MTRQMTLEEIRQAGLKALARELGAVGMVRFLQQFDLGHGDYTAEREGWLSEQTLDDIGQELRLQRSGKKPSKGG